MLDRRTFLLSMTAAGARHALAATSTDGAKSHRPADVLLMRHGEEPAKGPHLDDRGRQRAEALIKLFPSRFPKPTAIFAARTTAASARSVETVQPLASALGLRIDDSLSEAQYRRLANQLRSGAYDGGHVLVCWHRETLPALAEALGVKHAPAWKSSNYDHVWRIRYVNGKTEFSDESEQLLPGDK